MKICNFRKRDFQFAKQESVWNSTVQKDERVYQKPLSRRKNYPQPQNRKKIRSKSKTSCKTVKIYKCSHPSSQNPDRSDTVLTSGTYRGFAAIRDQWPLGSKRNRNPNGKIRKPLWKPNRKPIRQVFMTKPKNTC